MGMPNTLVITLTLSCLEGEVDGLRSTGCAISEGSDGDGIHSQCLKPRQNSMCVRSTSVFHSRSKCPIMPVDSVHQGPQVRC